MLFPHIALLSYHDLTKLSVKFHASDLTFTFPVQVFVMGSYCMGSSTYCVLNDFVLPVSIERKVT